MLAFVVTAGVVWWHYTGRIAPLIELYGVTGTSRASGTTTTLSPSVLSVPARIAPAAPMLPFYAVLRAWPGYAGGLVLLAVFYLSLAAIPWCDRGASDYFWRRPVMRWGVPVLALSIGVLAWAGAQYPGDLVLWISRIAFFLILAFLLALPRLTSRR